MAPPDARLSAHRVHPRRPDPPARSRPRLLDPTGHRGDGDRDAHPARNRQGRRSPARDARRRLGAARHDRGEPPSGRGLWTGEDDAAQFVRQTVDAADRTGRLRAILDAVRSHRVEDDFSHHWTYAREDFERKLYRKRSKIKVRFVELTDTVSVQGPESEIVDRLVFNDFLALLDPREREVVVLLRSGTTKLTEVAGIMGCRNHSTISKRLTRIRDTAARFFDED